MTKILLTGGSGFIGSHTLLELVKQNKYELAVFDNFKNGHREAIDIISKKFNKEIKVYEGDLLNYSQIENALKEFKPEKIIHFAALIEAGISVVEPTRFYENNVAGSINLFKAMQSNQIKKIVFSSTAAVYGTSETGVATETDKLNPENPYAWSKYMVEQILRDLSSDKVIDGEKLEPVILRYFNAAGADPELLIGQDYPKPTHLITLACLTALGHRDYLPIFGNDYKTKDGTCVRDYIHIADLANAHAKAVEYLDNYKNLEIFNIGTGKGTSNLEVIKILEKLHGPFSWNFEPRRVGDPAAYYANNSKAKQFLKWEPSYTVEDAVKHSYEWIKKMPNGYK
jgi:UDP-glucose 4-epimerase